MNGGGKVIGKVGLRPDPTGRADFVGAVGETVRLSIKSDSGAAKLVQATYGEHELSIGKDQFSFQITAGITALHLAVTQPKSGVVHLLEQPKRVGHHNELARFQSDIIELTIRGT